MTIQELEQHLLSLEKSDQSITVGNIMDIRPNLKDQANNLLKQVQEQFRIGSVN